MPVDEMVYLPSAAGGGTAAPMTLADSAARATRRVEYRMVKGRGRVNEWCTEQLGRGSRIQNGGNRSNLKSTYTRTALACL